MRGSLTPDALARVMRGLALSRKEGVLHLSKDGVSKRIYFKEGRIVFAGTDDDDERLGEVLIRAGKLKRSDLELALQVMKESGESLGKTVVEMGFTSTPDITRHALERTKAIIRSVFAWPSGQYSFEERDASIHEDMALELSTTEMILEGIRGIEDPEVVRQGLGDLKAILRQPQNPLVPYDEGSLSSSVEWILYQATGVSSIEDILTSSPVDPNKTLRSIFALVAAGTLELENPDQAMAAMGESTKLSAASSAFQQSSSRAASADSASPGRPSTEPHKIGRYEVKTVLGRGSMGAVYVANDPAIDRVVAVKVIQTAVQLSAAEFEQYRERFYREAKAAGKLLHPGIVTVFDVGPTEEETPYIVMEYVEGKTLHELLEAGPLTPDVAMQLSANILDALAYAHQKGIVHRDIKPGNIIVTADGQPKIMDFGIAHVVGSDFTQADEVLGSPNYMAPEQLSKGTIDQRTDLFAFGVVLYRMLTGKLPFTGDSFAAIAKGILFDEPTPPQNLNPAVATAVNSIVLRCLSKDPDQRFASAKELKLALLSSSRDQVVPDAPRRVTRTASSSNGTNGTNGTRTLTSTLRRTAAVVQDEVLRHPKRAAGGAAFFLLLSAGILALSGGQPVAQSAPPDEGATTTRDVDPAPGPTQTDTGIEISENLPDTTVSPVVASSEAELYHEASVAFERGDLDTTKAALERLIRRNPGFEGAAELLVKVNQRLRERSPVADTAAPPEQPAPDPPEAQLFYRTRLAFERGDLEDSKRQLEALLRAHPSFEIASELLVKVNDEIWKKSLPMSFRAKHNHRLGSCTGTLTLAAWGIRYASEDHEWRWDFAEIRLLEKDGRRILNLETHETDLLGLGKPKNYKFELRNPMRDDDWSRYRRLSR